MKTFAALVAVLLAASAAFAQGPLIRLDSHDGLESRADSNVDVTLDEGLLKMVANAFKGSKIKGQEQDLDRAKKVLSGLRGIYVRSYEFETEGAYNPGDVDAIRSQLKAPGWSRIVGVRSKKKGENAEVYVLTQNGQMAGLAVVAANPKELTVVNIVGTFDLEDLGDLDGEFGIPGLDVEKEKAPSSAN
jgi:hypothetical protein